MGKAKGKDNPRSKLQLPLATGSQGLCPRQVLLEWKWPDSVYTLKRVTIAYRRPKAGYSYPKISPNLHNNPTGRHYSLPHCLPPHQEN